MNAYLYTLYLTDIIEVYRIFVTYLTYLLQVITDFPLHLYFPHFFFIYIIYIFL